MKSQNSFLILEMKIREKKISALITEKTFKRQLRNLEILSQQRQYKIFSLIDRPYLHDPYPNGKLNNDEQ